MSDLAPLICGSVFAAAGIGSIAVLTHTISSNAARIVEVLETMVAAQQGRDAPIEHTSQSAADLTADGAATTAALLTLAHNVSRHRMMDEGPGNTRDQFKRFLREVVFRREGASLEQVLSNN